MAATMVLFGVHAFGQNGNNCENLLGDVNGDGYINILDLLLTKNQVLQDSSPTDCADSYIDGVIDVSDVAVTLMEIFGMSDNSGSCPDIAFYFEQESDNVLSLSFSVQSTPNFVSGLGLQMAISNLPPAASIVSVSSGDLEMSYSAENDLVLGCSLFGQSFLENGAEDVLTIEFSEAVSASELLGEILLPFCGDSFVTSFAESSGCMDESACNFFEFATVDDGSCVYDDACGICGGDNSSCSGCTHENATNYESTATIEDGSCLYSQEAFDAGYEAGAASAECPPCANSDCPGDFTADGYIGVDDILAMLSLYDTSCSE